MTVAGFLPVSRQWVTLGSVHTSAGSSTTFGRPAFQAGLWAISPVLHACVSPELMMECTFLMRFALSGYFHVPLRFGASGPVFDGARRSAMRATEELDSMPSAPSAAYRQRRWWVVSLTSFTWPNVGWTMLRMTRS
ncbi:hypothetical protein BJF83_05480 [Nocardiopsis sp. CNR-923]|nr:hypothetical protein BJF83_05480 [Nocardiopsis sp. CNR-923]